MHGLSFRRPKATQYGTIEKVAYGGKVKLILTAKKAPNFCRFFLERQSFTDSAVVGNPLVKLEAKNTKLSASNQRSIVIEKMSVRDVQVLLKMVCFKDVFLEFQQEQPSTKVQGLALYLLQIAELSRLNVNRLQNCPVVIKYGYRVQSELTIRNSTLSSTFRIPLYKFENLQKLILDNVEIEDRRTKKILFNCIKDCTSLANFLVVFSNNNRIESGEVFDCNFLGIKPYQIGTNIEKLLKYFGIPYLRKGRVKVRTTAPLTNRKNAVLFCTLFSVFRHALSFRRIPISSHLKKFLTFI